MAKRYNPNHEPKTPQSDKGRNEAEIKARLQNDWQNYHYPIARSQQYR